MESAWIDAAANALELADRASYLHVQRPRIDAHAVRLIDGRTDGRVDDPLLASCPFPVQLGNPRLLE